MKFKWFFVFFVLLLSGSLVFTALAGHASRSRSSGSVITTVDSEIIQEDEHDGDDDDGYDKLTGQFAPLHGGSSNNLKVKVRVNEQIRPLPGQRKINGIVFCQFFGGKLSPELGFPLDYDYTVYPHPAKVGSFADSSTVPSGEIVEGHFIAEITSEPDLSRLNSFCGSGYQALSFVPTAFESVVTETVILVDRHNRQRHKYVQSRAVDRCWLTGDPDTLQYQEQRPYHCIIIHEEEIGDEHDH